VFDLDKMVNQEPLTLSPTENDNIRAFAMDLNRTARSSFKDGQQAFVGFSPEICSPLYIVILAGLRAIEDGAVSVNDPL
jgi:hypothetical protein